MHCRCELKWHKFGLKHHRSASFGTSQWQDVSKISIPFLLYRFLFFAYFWAFFIINLVGYSHHELQFYMIYLTNWTYISVITDMALQFLSALAAAYRCHKGIKPLVPEFLYKTHWIVVNISHTIAPLVTVMYWAGVFPFLDIGVTYADIHLHLLTTLYSFADLFIHGTPRRFHHVIYPLCFGISYLLFSIIYYVCGGLDPQGNTGIYPILDWADPGLSSGTAVAACATVFLMHALSWGMTRLRLKLHGRWLGRQVTVEVGFDPSSGGGDAAGSGPAGARDVYVDVDIGDGGPTGVAPADGQLRLRPVDMQKAFYNPAMVTDGDSSSRPPATTERL